MTKKLDKSEEKVELKCLTLSEIKLFGLSQV